MNALVEILKKMNLEIKMSYELTTEDINRGKKQCDRIHRAIKKVPDKNAYRHFINANWFQRKCMENNIFSRVTTPVDDVLNKIDFKLPDYDFDISFKDISKKISTMIYVDAKPSKKILDIYNNRHLSKKITPEELETIDKEIRFRCTHEITTSTIVKNDLESIEIRAVVDLKILKKHPEIYQIIRDNKTNEPHLMADIKSYEEVEKLEIEKEKNNGHNN